MGPNIFAVVEGTWDWEDADDLCLSNPHTITFSDDRSLMVLMHRIPFVGADGSEDAVTRYEVREVSQSHIQGLIQGETRRTEAGEPVVWDLVLRSPDSYYWHRTDWPSTSGTKTVVRCTSAPPAALPE